MAELASHLASVDGATLSSNRPTLANVGSASTALAASRTWQLLISGNAYDPDANTQAELEVQIGGTTVARYVGTQQFGASPAGALAAQQIASARLFASDGTGTQTIQWRGASTTDGDGAATGLRALAFDVTDLPLNDGRYSSESANTDTVDTGPGGAAGWTTVQTLNLTPTRAGDHFILASMELVPNGSATTTQQTAARLVVDGVAVAGQAVIMDIGPNPTTIVRGFLAIHSATLTTGAHTVELQINGTLGGGNVDSRRRAIQVYESALFEDVQFAQQSAGLTLAAGASGLVPGIDVTLAAPASARRIVALFAGPSQTGFWKQGQFALGATPTLVTPGFGSATNDVGNLAGDDAMHDHGIYTASGVTASERFRVQYGQFAPGGGGGMVTGQNVAVADASGPASILAFILDAEPPAAGGTFELEATISIAVDTPPALLGVHWLMFADVTVATLVPTPTVDLLFDLDADVVITLTVPSDLTLAGVFDLAATIELALDLPSPTLGGLDVFQLAATIELAISQGGTLGGLVVFPLAGTIEIALSQGATFFALRIPRYPVTVTPTRVIDDPVVEIVDHFASTVGSVTPTIEDSIVDADGVAVDLSDAAVVLRLEHGSTGEVVEFDVLATSGGVVSRDWQAGDLAIPPGRWRGQYRATWEDGRVEVFPSPDAAGPYLEFRIWRVLPVAT